MLERHGLALERMKRNQRLFDDQSQIGRAGVVMTRIARATVAKLARELMTYQYVVVARKP
jgi:hypothetical protein